MQPEQWESPRAKAERERRERVLAFEAIMSQVDEGTLTLEGGNLDQPRARSPKRTERGW